MQSNKLGLGAIFFLAIATMFSSQASAQTFDFANNSPFDGGQGIGTTMTVGGVTASIVDVFAPEFIDDGTGTFVQTSNILRASLGDMVLADIGTSNSLGVNNPSVEDLDFFMGTGVEFRDLNDGEGLVIEFDVPVAFTELDFQSLDDGTVTVTVEGIGSFDFVDGTPGDAFANPFGPVLIPAGADITFSLSSPIVASASARIAEFTVATNIVDIPFVFANGTEFAGDQGVGATMVRSSLDGNSTATVSIVDLFAPEFVADATGIFAPTANILTASEGDLVTSDIGSNGLGVNNPSVTDLNFFGDTGSETRDFNDREGLVLSFDVDVSFLELDLDSVDDGTLTVTIPGLGSFDFIDEGLPGDQIADPFGLALIPAGTQITFEFSSPTVPSASIRIGSFIVTTEPRMPDAIKGDVDMSGIVDFGDIAPFIAVLQAGGSQAEADTNCDGMVDFGDIAPFIAILQGQ